MRRKRIAVAAAVGLFIVLAASQVTSMPMFARKYDMNCQSCHSVIPKLNETGMMFRASGWRPSADIGTEDKGNNEMANIMSARIQGRYDLTSKEDKNAVKSYVNQGTFYELTVYPLTGAFNKNWGSLVELTFAPEEVAEIENAYVRGNWKAGAEGVFSSRFGIFHPFEGYGASDRPASISRPLFQTTFAKDVNAGKTFVFTPWNLDQAGLEFGYDMKRTMVRGTVWNGISYENDAAGKAAVIPAQGGGLQKDPTRPSYASKDFQLTATQILTTDGGGITLFYYKGTVDIPRSGVPALAPFTQDQFYRAAAYASYPLTKKLMLMGGYQTGEDKYDSLTVSLKSKSMGYFGEVNLSAPRDFMLVGRYDAFDPSDNTEKDQAIAYTVAVNKPAYNGLQFIAEYQYKETEQGFKPSGAEWPKQKENKFQIRGIWIW